MVQVKDRPTVQSIDFFVTDQYGTKLYDSCKDVKFAAMNTRAMDFIGGGAKNYRGDWEFCNIDHLESFSICSWGSGHIGRCLVCM